MMRKAELAQRAFRPTQNPKLEWFLVNDLKILAI